jgi:cytosine/adenosine deaminase-related metal-dependent hydrolase
MYASAQSLDFLATTKNPAFPTRKLAGVHPEFPDEHYLETVLFHPEFTDGHCSGPRHPSPMTLYLARYLLPIGAPSIEDGAVLVRDGRLAAVGRRRDLQDGWSGATVDFGDALLLPPLVNAHTHLELTRFPRWAEQAGETQDGGGFVDWIIRLIRIKRRISPEELRDSLLDGLRLALEAGTGAVGDVLSCPPARSGYRNSPVYGRYFCEVLGLDPARVQKALDRWADLCRQGETGRLTPGLAPHAPYTLSPAAMRLVLDSAATDNLSLTLHFAESAEECRFLEGSTGAVAEQLYPFIGWDDRLPPPAGVRPAAWLDALGGLGERTLLVHGVQVTAEEADLLARRRATVVLCPRSNQQLQVGSAPVAHYRAAGVRLALGTDSLASSPTLSIWHELAAARRLYGAALAPGELLAMATINGALALGLDGEMGRLQPGWGGHFLVVRPPALPHFNELEEFLCNREGDPELAAFFLAGREILHST